MKKLIGFVGCTIGGAIGWAAGEPFGIMTAFLISMAGTAVGYLVGWRIADRMLE